MAPASPHIQKLISRRIAEIHVQSKTRAILERNIEVHSRDLRVGKTGHKKY